MIEPRRSSTLRNLEMENAIEIQKRQVIEEIMQQSSTVMMRDGKNIHNAHKRVAHAREKPPSIGLTLTRDP